MQNEAARFEKGPGRGGVPWSNECRFPSRLPKTPRPRPEGWADEGQTRPWSPRERAAGAARGLAAAGGKDHGRAYLLPRHRRQPSRSDGRQDSLCGGRRAPGAANTHRKRCRPPG